MLTASIASILTDYCIMLTRRWCYTDRSTTTAPTAHFPVVTSSANRKRTCPMANLRYASTQILQTHVTADAERTFSECQNCAQCTPKHRHKHKLQCFPTARPLELSPWTCLQPCRGTVSPFHYRPLLKSKARYIYDKHDTYPHRNSLVRPLDRVLHHHFLPPYE